MNEITKMLNDLKEVNERYGMSNDSISEYLGKMGSELLCVPIIGAFSSGKSAAVNTLLGYGQPVLKENITPETAVPAEIHYRSDEQSADNVYIYYNSGDCEVMKLSEYGTKRDELDYGKIAHIRLSLDNTFFSAIKHINLVDMPGFGSDNNSHDKAINNYVDKSMAYIIAFPADDMIMRDGVGDILRELCVLGKPICVMITKTDKAPSEEDFNAAWKQLEKNLKKYIGDREFEKIVTSRKEGYIDELKDYLLELDGKSEMLLREQKFLPFFKSEADKTLDYLRALLKNIGLSESELKEQEERLNADMKHLSARTAELAQRFQKDTEQCAKEIISDAQAALNSELDIYVAMAMNKSDGQEISESVNSTVRVAVASSFQDRFVSKAQKYIDNVSAEISATDSFISGISGANENTGTSIGDTAVSGVVGGVGGAVAGAALTALVPTIAAGGAVFFAPVALSIPVVGVVLAAVGVIGGIIASVLSGNKKREEAKSKLRQQFVSVVFPSVLNQLSSCVSASVAEKTAEICSAIEQQLAERKAVLEKALADCRDKQAGESEESARTKEEINKNIRTVEELRNGI